MFDERRKDAGGEPFRSRSRFEEAKRRLDAEAAEHARTRYVHSEEELELLRDFEALSVETAPSRQAAEEAKRIPDGYVPSEEELEMVADLDDLYRETFRREPPGPTPKVASPPTE